MTRIDACGTVLSLPSRAHRRRALRQERPSAQCDSVGWVNEESKNTSEAAKAAVSVGWTSYIFSINGPRQDATCMEATYANNSQFGKGTAAPIQSENVVAHSTA